MDFTIETERLLLKPLAISELDELCALRSDPDVMRYIGKVQTRDEVIAFIKLAHNYFDEYGLDFFSAFEKQTGDFIGQAGLFHLMFNLKQPDIELGYRLHKRYWGKGYASELATALIKYGFEQLSLPKIIAGHEPENLASKKVIEKVGFQYTGLINYRGTELPFYEIINKRIKLEPLNKHPHLIPEIIDWYVNEFSHFHPNKSRNDFAKRLQSHLDTNTLPVCYVLLNGNKLIATAALREFDIDSYQSVSPWLGSVIVAKKCRGKGIGSLLMKLLMSKAKKIHCGAWYLFTEDQRKFYAHHDWKRIDTTVYNGVQGTVMKYTELTES